MTEQQTEELRSACVVLCNAVAFAAQVAKDLTAALSAMTEKAMGIGVVIVWEEEKPTDLREALLRAIEEINTTCPIADFAEDPAEKIVVKKLPRPQKRIGPINKANYSANRPARRARSSCYRRRH